MRTIFGWFQKMSAAAAKARPMLAALVRQAEFHVGSKMMAYDVVGRSVGTTGSWIRKFLGNQPVRLDADLYLTLVSKYDAYCLKWEERAAQERELFFSERSGGADETSKKHNRVPLLSSGPSNQGHAK